MGQAGMVRWDTSEAAASSAVQMGGNWSKGCTLCLWGLCFLLSGVLHMDHSKRLLHGWPGLIAFTSVGKFFSLIKYYCSGDHQG